MAEKIPGRFYPDELFLEGKRTIVKEIESPIYADELFLEDILNNCPHSNVFSLDKDKMIPWMEIDKEPLGRDFPVYKNPSNYDIHTATDITHPPKRQVTPIHKLDLSSYGIKSIVYIKDESDRNVNPTGTIKDIRSFQLGPVLHSRWATALTYMAGFSGDFKINDRYIPRLCELTAGNSGISLARMFEKYSLPPVKLILDEKTDSKIIDQLKKEHAEIYLIPLDKNIMTNKEEAYSSFDLKIISNNIYGFDTTSMGVRHSLKWNKRDSLKTKDPDDASGFLDVEKFLPSYPYSNLDDIGMTDWEIGKAVKFHGLDAEWSNENGWKWGNERDRKFIIDAIKYPEQTTNFLRLIDPSIDYYRSHINEVFDNLSEPAEVYLPFGSGETFNNYITFQSKDGYYFPGHIFNLENANLKDISILAARPEQKQKTKAKMLSGKYNPAVPFSENLTMEAKEAKITGVDTGIYEFREKYLRQAIRILEDNKINAEPSAAAGLALFLQRYYDGDVDSSKKHIVINTGKGVYNYKK